MSRLSDWRFVTVEPGQPSQPAPKPAPKPQNFSDVAKDTINWFDESGELTIGLRSNPAHVQKWQSQKGNK